MPKAEIVTSREACLCVGDAGEDVLSLFGNFDCIKGELRQAGYEIKKHSEAGCALYADLKDRKKLAHLFNALISLNVSFFTYATSWTAMGLLESLVKGGEIDNDYLLTVHTGGPYHTYPCSQTKRWFHD